MIVIMAITAMLLVPATIVAVTVYAQQQQQQNEDRQLQETHINNTVGSVGNTSTDDVNPEYNSTKTKENPALTEKQISMRVNELLDEIGRLYIENQGLYETVSDDSMPDGHTLDRIAQNNQTMQLLEDEINRLDPIPLDIYIPEEDIARMEKTMLALIQTDIPLFQMGINRATGTLDLIVDIRYAYPGVEDDIKKYTRDIPVVITYAENTAKLQ